MSKDSKKLAIGVVIAAGIGYAAGLLTAPRSGKETREELGKAARKTKREIEAKIKTLNGEVGDLIKAGNQRLKSLTGAAKRELQQALKKAQAAHAKAREVLSALHEGEADDEDLDSAVKDLKTAVSNLKKYTKKPSVDKAE